MRITNFILIEVFFMKHQKKGKIFRFKCKLNGAISTDVYGKPTDGHQYLHYKSSHPEHKR